MRGMAALLLVLLVGVGCTSSDTTTPPSPRVTTAQPTASTPSAAQNVAQTTPSPSAQTDTAIATPFIMPTAPPARGPFCSGLLPTRLTLNMRGRVTEEDDRSLNIREGAGTSARIVSQLFPDETFAVLEGPLCADGYTWYRVRARDGRNGWVAEGDDEVYYVEPYPPR